MLFGNTSRGSHMSYCHDNELQISFVMAILQTVVGWFQPVVFFPSYKSTLCCVMDILPILLFHVWWPSCQLYNVFRKLFSMKWLLFDQLYFVLCDPTISTLWCVISINATLLCVVWWLNELNVKHRRSLFSKIMVHLIMIWRFFHPPGNFNKS